MFLFLFFVWVVSEVWIPKREKKKMEKGGRVFEGTWASCGRPSGMLCYKSRREGSKERGG